MRAEMYMESTLIASLKNLVLSSEHSTPASSSSSSRVAWSCFYFISVSGWGVLGSVEVHHLRVSAGGAASRNLFQVQLCRGDRVRSSQQLPFVVLGDGSCYWLVEHSCYSSVWHMQRL